MQVFFALILVLTAEPAIAFTGQPSPDRLPSVSSVKCREERVKTAGPTFGWISGGQITVLHCLRVTRFRPHPNFDARLWRLRCRLMRGLYTLRRSAPAWSFRSAALTATISA
jgi:hypothetical protein